MIWGCYNNPTLDIFNLELDISLNICIISNVRRHRQRNTYIRAGTSCAATSFVFLCFIIFTVCQIGHLFHILAYIFVCLVTPIIIFIKLVQRNCKPVDGWMCRRVANLKNGSMSCLIFFKKYGPLINYQLVQHHVQILGPTLFIRRKKLWSTLWCAWPENLTNPTVKMIQGSVRCHILHYIT